MGEGARLGGISSYQLCGCVIHTAGAESISPPGIMEHFAKLLPNFCSIDET